MNRFIIPFVLLSMSIASQAQETSNADLQQQLQLRDNTILELLERLEVLENRAGIRQQPRQDIESATEETDDTDRPGAVVVTRAQAERALERSLSRDGALLLPSGVFELELNFQHSHREQSSPGFLTANDQLVATSIEQRLVRQTTSVALRSGLPWDTQLELTVPYHRSSLETVTSSGFAPVNRSSQSEDGIGDWRIGLAKTLYREGLNAPDVIARLSYDSDSADAQSFEALSASLTFSRRQDPLNFVGGLSYSVSEQNNDIQPGEITSINFGAYIAMSPQTSLNFQLALAKQSETAVSGDSIAGSSRDLASLIIGGSTILAPGSLLHVSTAIGLTQDSDDYSIQMSLPFRFN